MMHCGFILHCCLPVSIYGPCSCFICKHLYDGTMCPFLCRPSV
jgi:hypothetical protein